MHAANFFLSDENDEKMPWVDDSLSQKGLFLKSDDFSHCYTVR